MFRIVVVAAALVSVIASSAGCLVFQSGIACNADDPATCPEGTTCVAGECVVGDDPPPPPPPGPFCGDGNVDTAEGEQCDDGNGDNSDGCHVDCTTPACGDGFTDAPGEQCDDGNDVDGDGCTDCALDAVVEPPPVCGDGLINGKEECDFAQDPDNCNTDCTDGDCGDAQIDGDEECDDGNLVDGDGCSDCIVDEPVPPPEVCGDGIVNGTEECDFAADSAECNTDCTDGVCGDGLIDGDEGCDDGNVIDGDGCTLCFVDGVAPVCGDGVVNGLEDCDFAATPDTCNTNCTDGVCGDGLIDGDEECDDNAVAGDGCTGCALDGPPPPPPPVCGDGVVNGGEDCDIALTPGTCNVDCSNSVCGDGQRGPDEECDEGAAVPVAVAGLDGVSTESTFEVNTELSLPFGGWQQESGVPRVFDLLGNGVLLGTDSFANYSVRYETGEAVRANTTYTLHFDMGSVAGAGTGGLTTFDFELGTVDAAGAFTRLGRKSGSIVNQGNLVTAVPPVVSASVDLVVATGGDVSGDALVVRWAHRSNNGVNDFLGFDNVTLFRADRCADTCALEPDPFCGDGVVTAGEDCDGGLGCTDSCRQTTPCATAVDNGACVIDVAGPANNRTPRLVDLNGDQLPELITTESEQRRVFIQTQFAPGLFGAPLTINTTLNARLLEVGDVDGDGDVDLLTGGNNENALQVLRNQGDLVFDVEAPFTTGIDDTRQVHVVDLDGDGDVDIRVGGLNSNGILVVRNDGTGSNFVVDVPSFVQGPGGAGIVGVAVGDVDGDGDLDVATANFFVGSASVFLCDGVGGCVFNTQLAGVGGTVNATNVAIGDVDSDGRADVVLGSANGSSLTSFFRGLGDGAFESAVSIGTVTNAGHVLLRDLDGDGRSEIVINSPPTGTAVIFKHALGNFFFQQTVACGGASEAFFIGDTNRDGRDDVVCSDPASGFVRFRLSL